MEDEPAWFRHRLRGCRATPLASYLKALAIHRLIVQQVDADALGLWRDDGFELVTRLDEPALVDFFLTVYAPTPILAPWNGGSGFYQKDNRDAVEAIRASAGARFAPYRDAIEAGFAALSGRTEKPTPGIEKNAVIRECRLRWRGAAADWLDAVLVRDENGEPSFPALLGTGGNDGRLEFTNNFMQRLGELFDLSLVPVGPRPRSPALLREALFGTDGPVRTGTVAGQFLPNVAGSVNGTTGFDGSVQLNAWDFILMLEGAVLITSGLAKRLDSQGTSRAAAPFAVRSVASGYGHAADTDTSGRGEQWFPIWSRPAALGEVRALFREARASVGGRAPRNGIEMVRAIMQRAVDRRIDGFVRYGYLERNGLAYLAVPIDRIDVPRSLTSNLSLLEELGGWHEDLRRWANHKTASDALKACLRSCDTAVYECAVAASRGSSDVSSEHYLRVLLTMAAAEQQLVRSPRFAAAQRTRPVSRPLGHSLSAEWLEVTKDGSHEYAIARALSQAYGSREKKHWPIAAHWLPLALGSVGRRAFAVGEAGLLLGPDQCAVHLDFVSAAIAILQRRRLASDRSDGYRLPLTSTSEYGVSLDAIRRFLTGQLDDSRILQLTVALMMVNGRPHRQATPEHSTMTDRSKRSTTSLGANGLAGFAALRLSTPGFDAPIRLNDGKQLVLQPSIVPLLAAGRLADAGIAATRRLNAQGLRVRFPHVLGDERLARRLAAALIIPLAERAWSSLFQYVVEEQFEDDPASVFESDAAYDS